METCYDFPFICRFSWSSVGIAVDTHIARGSPSFSSPCDALYRCCNHQGEIE